MKSETLESEALAEQSQIGWHVRWPSGFISAMPSKGAARLAAAAPRMKLALMECDVAFCHWQLGQIPGRPEDILALINVVRQAIAAAEGEQ